MACVKTGCPVPQIMTPRLGPTGPIEDDPNLTNARFKGNPTKSFRSREPLRVTGEVLPWQGHPADFRQAVALGVGGLC